MADGDSHSTDSTVSTGLCQVSFFFPDMFNDTCASHTIDNVGKHIEFGVLHTFSGTGTPFFFFVF